MGPVRPGVRDPALSRADQRSVRPLEHHRPRRRGRPVPATPSGRPVRAGPTVDGLARVGIFVLRALAAVRAVLTRHKLHYALLVVTLIMIAAGVLVWVVELDEPEANINSVGDGLWWAVTTLTTVGYGDRYPTSPMGKGIAVVLMLVGVALLGLLAANLASILIRGLHDEPESTSELQEVLERLDRIERALGTGSHDATEESRSNDAP